ncbi:MAG: UDP-glucose/GDP-mannose dehydrogenase family protein [Armatimonadetes bacterium]|nr:UDP-glucose/GDP-mannose dehydrogenase family protein [Armatimonadota bacterium]
MRVSVFGLGYVGAVASACLARDGHQVIGVDANADKVAQIRAGRAPVIEEGLDALIVAGVGSGRLTATTDAAAAVADSEISLISVGTPSRANGSLDLTAVERVAADLGRALAGKAGAGHVVVLRSTVLPGTTRGLLAPSLAREAGWAVPVCFNPEFLREGSSIRDFDDPPFTILGADDEATAKAVAPLYGSVSGDVVHCALENAELLKYVSNSWHAVKVAFANEVGSVAAALGVDGGEVMRLFARDEKLNISARYLMPGFAFGGSCLPKDLRALTYRARELDVETPLLSSVLPSNRVIVERAVEAVLATGCRRVAMLGLAFKSGTDDLRESPLVTLAEALLGKGCELRIYDENVSLTRLVGANRAYVDQRLPHLSALLSDDLDAVVAHGEVIILGQRNAELAQRARAASGQVIDLS